MNVALPKYKQTTLEDLLKSTFLQGSAAEAQRLDSQTGLTTDLFGQEAAPASHSVQPVTIRARKTKGTCGHISTASLASANLTKSLVNRLKGRLSTDGSMIYKQTWKEKVTPSGIVYWEHTARQRKPGMSVFKFSGLSKTSLEKELVMNSGNGGSIAVTMRDLIALVEHRISGKDFTGLPTPTSSTGGSNNNSKAVLERGHGMNLEGAAVLMGGWPSASARDWKDSSGMATTGINPDGSVRNRLDQLPRVAAVAGWATPNTLDTLPARSSEAIERQFSIARKGRTAPANLREQVHPELYPSGAIQTGSTSWTTSTGQLNPALSRWLMGYREEWDIAAIQASRSMPTKRKRHELCV